MGCSGIEAAHVFQSSCFLRRVLGDIEDARREIVTGEAVCDRCEEGRVCVRRDNRSRLGGV